MKVRDSINSDKFDGLGGEERKGELQVSGALVLQYVTSNGGFTSWRWLQRRRAYLERERERDRERESRERERDREIDFETERERSRPPPRAGE
jgi:hypothetical protein